MTRPKKQTSTSNGEKKTSMHAIELLKKDHQTVKALFEKFEKAPESAKEGIVRTALKELTVHAAIEEDIFYPAVRENMKGNDLEIMDEAEEEHHVAKFLISELEDMEASDEHFEAKFKVLAENVRHHIQEEEKEMLPKAQKTGLDFEELGQEMRDLKEQLAEQESEPTRQVHLDGR